MNEKEPSKKSRKSVSPAVSEVRIIAKVTAALFSLPADAAERVRAYISQLKFAAPND